jgi:hypothetical protein
MFVSHRKHAYRTPRPVTGNREEEEEEEERSG